MSTPVLENEPAVGSARSARARLFENGETVGSAPSARARLARDSILSRLQQGLERLYRVQTNLDVDAFVVDDSARDEVLGDRTGAEGRRPREQLLVRQGEGDVALGLFVDDATIENLERHDPSQGLNDNNFHDFCLAVEGVSHFVYVAICAARDRAVSALELELQAEVDKFVSCVLTDGEAARRPNALAARLYEDVRFADNLDPHERGRYETANTEARRYAAALERRFLRPSRLADMLPELRRFYRLPLDAKLGHIAGL